MQQTKILGVQVSITTTRQILDLIRASVASTKALTIYPVNVDVVMKSRNESPFRDILNRADITPSDGLPIVWASRFLGAPIKEKTTGWILFENICHEFSQNNSRVFFLGGEVGIPERAAQNLRKKYPGLNIVGTYSPPQGFEDDESESEKVIRLVRAAKPDIVFVGLGAPKQEKWIDGNRETLGAAVLMAVGGSFDFYAGKVRRPPLFFVRIGLGWLWRIVQEPRRLWKRYLVEDSPFFYYVLQQKRRVYSDP